MDAWLAGFEQRAEQARALSTRLATLTVTARSRDGLVEAVVNSSGVVCGLRLEEGIRQQAATRTAEQILAVLTAARSRLGQQVAAVVADTVGADSPTGQAVIASYRKQLGPAGEAGGGGRGR